MRRSLALLLILGSLVACEPAPPSVTPEAQPPSAPASQATSTTASQAPAGGPRAAQASPTLPVAAQPGGAQPTASGAGGTTPAKPTAAAAGGAPRMTASVATAPEAMEQQIRQMPRPARDLVALVQRLKLHGQDVPRIVNPQPPSYAVGTRHRFWIADQPNKNYFEAEATIQHVSPHAYWYVQNGVAVDVNQLRRSAASFEEKIYPTVRRYFGEEPNPGVDNDPRITIYLGRVPGVGGYYSSADAVARAVNPFSNERDIIYLNSDAVPPGTPRFEATVSHEFQHMVHWAHRPNDDTWINEGSSVLMERLMGHPVGLGGTFLQNPNTQLTAWSPSERQDETLRHYGAGYLFMSYFAHRFGGYDRLKDFVSRPEVGLDAFDAVLAAQGRPERFDDVFRDWVIANVLDDPKLEDGRYGYADIEAKTANLRRLTPGQRQSVMLNQYAAQYFEVSGGRGDLQLSFQGNATVKQLDNEPKSGQSQWWSNRGDMTNTTLTRELDLTRTPVATLAYSAWYDLEKDYDYAYVEVSADSGKTWTTLQTPNTTATNPNGANLGHGYTGTSGGRPKAVWVSEQIDLSPYAGRKVLVRFELVTDDAYNAPGFAIDDLSVPEIGLNDDAEGDTGWVAEGFVRGALVVPQRFDIQVIRFEGGSPKIERIPVTDAKAQVAIAGFGQSANRVVVAVSATAMRTTEPANFAVELR
ncbi:MAG: immune inhibitor A [Chloroflexi bacterium]|nr:immune inhibitor A [Chloroflexota bacterium]